MFSVRGKNPTLLDPTHTAWLLITHVYNIISSHKRFGALCSWHLQWPVALIWFIYEASYSFIVFYLFVVLLSSFRFDTQLQLRLSSLIPTHCSIFPSVQTAYGARASVTRPEGTAGHAPKSTVGVQECVELYIHFSIHLHATGTTFGYFPNWIMDYLHFLGRTTALLMKGHQFPLIHRMYSSKLHSIRLQVYISRAVQGLELVQVLTDSLSFTDLQYGPALF